MSPHKKKEKFDFVEVSIKSEIRPYQRRQSSSGLHRPGGGREDSLLLSSLSVSGAGKTQKTQALGKKQIEKTLV